MRSGCAGGSTRLKTAWMARVGGPSMHLLARAAFLGWDLLARRAPPYESAPRRSEQKAEPEERSGRDCRRGRNRLLPDVLADVERRRFAATGGRLNDDL